MPVRISTPFALIVLIGLLIGCADPIDMTRQEYERGTLGEELYKQLHRDLLRTEEDSDRKAAALEDEQEAFISAIDTMMPASAIPAVEDFVVELLPLYDDNRLPDLIRKLGFVYDDIVASEDLRRAWVRTTRVRAHYQNLDTDADPIARIIEYPRLRELTLFTMDLILDHDGLNNDGSENSAENDYIRRLLLSARDQLLDPADPREIHRTVAALTDMLLQSDPRFAGAEEHKPLWAVQLDYRGLASPNRGDGGLPAVFTDSNGDQLPDVDGAGRFVNRDNGVFVIPPFGTPSEVLVPVSGQPALRRDAMGRALDQDEQPVFDYVDLNQTPLGFVIRRVPDLVDRGIVVDSMIGFEGLLGELDTTSQDYPHFTTETPILDLVHAGLNALAFDSVPDLLEGVSILLDEHTQALATLLVVMEANSGIGDRHNAHLEEDNAFFDDLAPYLYEISQHKGLLDELATALQDPMINNMLIAMIELNSSYNPAIRPPLDGPYNTQAAACFDLDVGSQARFDCLRAVDDLEIFAGDVDHTLPEGTGNTSLAQRLMHLVHDGSGSPFHMIIEEATLFGVDISELADLGALLTIPDVAAAFFDSVAGNFCLVDHVNVDQLRANPLLNVLVELLDAIGLANNDGDLAQLVTDLIVALSDELGVHLDECPGPDQLIRFFNLPSYELSLLGADLRLANGFCTAGYEYQSHHADSLYAAEAAGAVDGLYPLLKVLSDRGLTPLFAELIRDLYRHYPGPEALYYHEDGTPEDLVYSNARSFEPVLNEFFEQGRLIDAIQDLLAALQAIELSNGGDIGTTLEDLLSHLFDSSIEIESLRGETSVQRGDGVLTSMTYFYLLTNALDRVDRWVNGTEAEEAWERASEELMDLLLEVRELVDGSGIFADPGSPALVTVLSQHLASHLTRHRTDGRLIEELTVDYFDAVEESLTSRGFAAVIELMTDVRQNADDQALFDDFLLYLTEEDELAIRAGLSVMYDALVGTNDGFSYPAVAPFFGRIIDPERVFDVDATEDVPLVTHLAQVLNETMIVDVDGIGIDLIRRSVISATPGQDPPATVVGRVIRQINRLEPGSSELVSADDMASLYSKIAAYIRDDHRGLERAFEAVQTRGGP